MESRFSEPDFISIEWDEPIWFFLPRYTHQWGPTLYEHHVLSFSLNEDGSIKRVLMGYCRHYGDGLSWSSLPLTREETP